MSKTNFKIIDENLYERYKLHKEKIPGLFFDRDGVLIKEKNYIKMADNVELERYSVKHLRNLLSLNFINIIVTNQSGISRGLLNWNDYINVTNRMKNLIGKPNLFSGIYANSLSDNNFGNDLWRKPNPGMIFEAAKDFPIDLSKSVMIGDKFSDLISGARANISKVIHVLTGHGKEERKIIKEKFAKSCYEESLKVPQLILVDSLAEVSSNILLF